MSAVGNAHRVYDSRVSDPRGLLAPLEPGERPTTSYGLKYIGPHHRTIMRLQLRGLHPGEIADCVNLTITQVSHIINSQIYKAEFKKLQERADQKAVDTCTDVKRTIERLSGKSIETLERILDDTRSSPRLQADVAFDLLDRAGFKAVEKREVIVDYTQAAIAAYKRRNEEREARGDTNVTVVVANQPGGPRDPLPERTPDVYTLEGFAEPSLEPDPNEPQVRANSEPVASVVGESNTND